MKDSTPQSDLYALAGEYYLGLLSEAEAKAFAERLVQEPECQQALLYWQERLTPLAGVLEPHEPPHHVWNGIELRMEGEGAGVLTSFWDSIRFWRPMAILATAAVLALFIWGKGALIQTPQMNTAPLVAMVGAAQASPQYLLSYHPQSRKLVIQTLADINLPAGRALELWMFPGQGAPPVSCGLLPVSGTKEMTLPKQEVPYILQGEGLAVTEEPAGGAPGGQATGPVIYQGKFLRI